MRSSVRRHLFSKAQGQGLQTKCEWSEAGAAGACKDEGSFCSSVRGRAYVCRCECITETLPNYSTSNFHNERLLSAESLT